MTEHQIEQGLAARCWESIGVRGDRSCPELRAVVHCRNCPVFASAGRALVDRPPPAGYQQERTTDVAAAAVPARRGDRSLVLVRLGREWLGVDTRSVVEIIGERGVHRIPHRTQGALLGLVNVRGQLRLCASLHRVLGIEPPDPASTTRRLVVMGAADETWVVPVDEVYDVIGFASEHVVPGPLTVTAALGTHTRGVVAWRDAQVGILATDILFATLRRSLA